ncbi:hypothetical protein ONZ45_g8338 [Pleurotus djamor]|nr:hypothetical protein ONZ45_g8338 [Pleurotus djamor]
MFDYGRRTPELVVLDDPKAAVHDAPHHVYVADHKPYAVQIIQLVEAQPPPRTEVSSYPESSEYYSSSSSSSSLDDDSDCESYCSSAPPSEEQQESSAGSYYSDVSPDTYALRMKRIFAWREDFNSHMSSTLCDPSLSSPLKRKIDSDDCDELASQSSKRSRRSHSDASSGSLGEHSCPACDASFETKQSLRQHGRDAQANEACCVAVDYAFE